MTELNRVQKPHGTEARKCFMGAIRLTILCLFCGTTSLTSHLALAEEVVSENSGMRIALDKDTGLPTAIESSQRGGRQWLTAPGALSVQNKLTGRTASPTKADHHSEKAVEQFRSTLEGLGLSLTQQWSRTDKGHTWRLSFSGDIPRVEHAITIDLPVLQESDYVFTPSQRGVTRLASRPTFQPPSYASFGYDDQDVYVLPLVSVLDKKSDNGLTLALRADANIPHMQVEWKDAKTLRLTFARRGMGGGKPTDLEILFLTHEADYRAALREYSELFPRYFEPGLPRGPHEGTFYYHHIHDHPEFEELASQNVRYIWSSFWFTHLGEYLPEAKEWEPYTYARWWRLGQKMSDKKINAFTEKMESEGIGTFAYFNVTEYGGYGGKLGSQEEAGRRLRDQFANALMKRSDGRNIPTWEGAMAMNPGSKYALWPFLQMQIKRHLERVPNIQGFIIDRLDWANKFDYGHSDGLSMILDKPVENMAVPVGEAVREVCRLSHDAGKRVYLNQFWRIEVLRDGDGVCHESDPLPALGYISPLRPSAAWHHRAKYAGDMLRFEAQIKRRIQWALFPQMIAHKFPISQQGASPRAADLLTIYAPLFKQLEGKRQVLEGHCVTADGANDVNLYINGAGHYVAPVSSRVRFLSRNSRTSEPVTVTIRTKPDEEITWAHVYSADRPPYRATVNVKQGKATVIADHHGTASMIVAGAGKEPALDSEANPRLVEARAKWHGKVNAPKTQPVSVSDPDKSESVSEEPSECILVLRGEHAGIGGTLEILANGKSIGRLENNEGRFPLKIKKGSTLRVEFLAADQGVWFIPEKVELFATTSDGKINPLSQWNRSGKCGLQSDFSGHMWVELE